MFELIINSEVINIYEHKDAEVLIKKLAREYRKDVTYISKGGKGRNKIAYYNYPCSFDIETSTFKSGEYGYFHKDKRPIAAPYLFQFCIYGKVIMTRYIEEAIDVFNWLGDYFIRERKRKLIIFVHNLSYEYGFLKDYWKLNFKECFALDLHHPISLQLENGVLLRDSYKMSNMSLETLTKDWSIQYFKKKEIMDYKKQRFPWSELDKNTLEYSALDVLSLSDAMAHFLKAHNTGVWTNCPTSTSFIRAECKKVVGIGVKKRTKAQKEYIKTIQKCKIDLPIYNMLERQARGGNTHANRYIIGQLIGSQEGTGVLHDDIASSYPDKMVTKPEFPIDAWNKIDENADIDELMFMEKNGYCTLFDMVLINPRLKDNVIVPYLSLSQCRTLKGATEYSDNGRYMRGANMLETTIYGIEFNIIANQYDFDEVVILRGYYARKGYLPNILREYILKLYTEKTELKGIEGKEVEYSLAKTFVNGV